MIDGGRARPCRCTSKWFPPPGPGSSPVVRRGGASRGCMTNFMRKALAGIWLTIALGALVGLVAHLSGADLGEGADRKSTRLNSSHVAISYAVFCLKKKNNAKISEEGTEKSMLTGPNRTT